MKIYFQQHNRSKSSKQLYTKYCSLIITCRRQNKWEREWATTDIQGRSQTSFPTQCNMASSAMGSNWGSSGFLPTTHKKQTQIKRIHDLRTPCGVFMHDYLHAQTTVDVQTTVILITRNPEDSQFEPHAGIKLAQVLGSPVYICGSYLHALGIGLGLKQNH